MMIFRILCGEWIEPLWDCMRAEEKVCGTIIAFSIVALFAWKINENPLIFFFAGWGIDVLFDFSSDTCYGKFYGFKFVLGLVA